MNRKALIISNPGEIGNENYCEGVNKDVVNYKKFLTSPQGGYWYDSEIICLEKPSSQMIQAYLDILQNYDYTLIIFCGHGYSYRDETILQLKEGIDIYANSLKIGAKKRTVILDCCRVIDNTLMESAIVDFASRIEKSAMDGIRARQYYNELLAQCPNGVVVTYACDLNEEAGDDSRLGGYYSYSLIKSAKNWLNQSHYYKTSESIVKVHDWAAELTKEKSGDTQHPQIEKPRSTPYFPFVVCV